MLDNLNMAGANATSIMRLPKPRDLTDMETEDSLEHWINQATVYIQRDTYMQPFLTRTWNSSANNRGQLPLGDISAQDMATYNELFLKHIASFLPNPFFKERVLKRTTDIASVWDIFRENYNVEKCAESFLDLATLEYKKTESYFTFYHRILYMIEQNLAPAAVTVDQITTPAGGDKLSVSMMDVAASWWLMKIDPRLPEHIKSAYSVQIRNKQRLSELVPQIAKSIPGILKRLDGFKKDVVNCLRDMSINDGQVTEESVNTSINALSARRPPPRRGNRSRNGRRNNRDKPLCRHCNWIRSFLKISEVDPYHPTEQCTRKMPDSVRTILDNECPKDDSDSEDYESADDQGTQNDNIIKKLIQASFQTKKTSCTEVQPPPPKAQDDKNKVKAPLLNKTMLSETDAQRLKLRAIKMASKASSPKMLVTHDGTRSAMLIDEGAELNALCADYAKKKKIRLAPSTRSASGAGNKNLIILGETAEDFLVSTKFNNTKVNINLGKITVVKDLGTPIICGEPGKAFNNIQTDSKHRLIHLVRQGEKLSKPYMDSLNLDAPNICRIKDNHVTLFPEDTMEFPLPEHLVNTEVFITPRRGYEDYIRPGIVQTSSTVTIENISMFPLNLKKHQQVADVRLAKLYDEESEESNMAMIHQHSQDDFKFKPTVKVKDPPDLDKIQVDPDNQLSPEMKQKFIMLNKVYEDLFTTTPGRYSGRFGDVDTSLNFTSPPIQTRKVHVPNYSKEMKDLLADKMDELRRHGVLMTPEEVGVTVQFLSPSMLVPKPDSDDFRLVSDFTPLNKYVKRDASSSPTIQEAKSDLSKKKMFIELDLTSYFFQGGLRRSDTAFLGIQHPYDGVLVYTASPQGLKNSSEHSYNRLARVYGSMMKEEKLTRMADGLFVLANDEQELYKNYMETLEKARIAGFTFKPKKVRICPRSTVVFGWKLEDGLWTPQDHVVSSLAKVDFPTTIKQLRSYIGAVKQLAPCVPSYGILLAPFEKLVAARSSAERITWTEDLKESFNKIKKAVADPSGLHYPLKTDKLQIFSDYSQQHGAIGGHMTIIRTENGEERKLLGGHFSATLSKDQCAWLSCEGESKGVQKIAQHFEPFIRENDNITTLYCDNMPTVRAWAKMQQGQFSTSPRISAFLSTLSTLPIRLEHRPGSSLEVADHASRHASPPCKGNCAICKFLEEEVKEGDNCDKLYSIEDNQSDDHEGNEDIDETKVPFLQLSTWKNLQMNDGVHSKLMQLIKTGQEPERRKTGGTHTTVKHLHTLFVKNQMKIHKGVLMVRTKNGFWDGHSISVPEHIFPGLCFSFHHRLHHPSKGQLTKFISRYFFTTALPNIVEKITNSCVKCLATMKLPKILTKDTTTIPEGFGTSFASDVIERNGQAIMVTKEIFSQHVSAMIIEDQTAQSLRHALITTISPLISMKGAEVRVDSAPGFQSISKQQTSDPILSAMNLKIILGHPLNKNRNPSAESCIAELKREILNIVSASETLDPSLLAWAVRNLNTRVRKSGKSAMEIVTSRDIMTGKDIIIDTDQHLGEMASRREAQHKENMKTNLRTRVQIPVPTFNVGDIVMYREMSNLNKSRDTFVVDTVKDDIIIIRKMNDQLRAKTYEVKPEQLIQVFNNNMGLSNDESKLDNKIPVRAEHDPPTSNRPKRKAAQKQRNMIHSKILEKLICISVKEKKKETKKKKKEDTDYVILETHWNTVELDELTEDVGDPHPIHQLDAVHDDVRQEFDQYDGLLELFHHQDDDMLTEYNTDNETDDTFNTAFNTSGDNLSIASMSNTSRFTLFRNIHYPSTEESTTSLHWDNDAELINLSDPLAAINISMPNSANRTIYQYPSSSDQDEVFDNIPERSASTPITGVVTRSMVASGEYDLRSPLDISPLVRNSRSRQNIRRRLRVTFADNAPTVDTVQNVENAASMSAN